MTFICPDCKVEYRMKKSGAIVETMMVDGPYQLFSADIHGCPACGKEFFHLAERPIAEHFESDYQQIRGRIRLSLRAWKNREEKQQYDIRYPNPVKALSETLPKWDGVERIKPGETHER